MAEGQIEKWRMKDRPNIEVLAVRLTEDNAAQIAVWCRGELVEEIDPEHQEETMPAINLPTPTGIQRASLHMYIVQAQRTFMTTHSRRFEMSYEPVNREAPPLESAGEVRKRLGFSDPWASPPGVGL